jgi:hypothetical protein
LPFFTHVSVLVCYLIFASSSTQDLTQLMADRPARTPSPNRAIRLQTTCTSGLRTWVSGCGADTPLCQRRPDQSPTLFVSQQRFPTSSSLLIESLKLMLVPGQTRLAKLEFDQPFGRQAESPPKLLFWKTSTACPRRFHPDDAQSFQVPDLHAD